MSIVGLEHEYIVRRGETVVDFRTLLHHLSVPGRRLDPGDPHAYRLRTGAALTCDGAEAEIATPPIDLSPGFVGAVDAWARASTAQLQGVLGAGYALEGVSTHMSVEVPDESAAAVAALFARHFAPALMLLSDGIDSPGLLVRPRFGRVELGTDYTSGPHRRASTALAAGGVLACLDVARRARPSATLPRSMRTDFVPATARWGWYVDRRAFGIDLYEHGRTARLRRARGLGHDGAQDVLERSWSCARAALARFASPSDLRDADVVVSASMPLPCEHDRGRAPEQAVNGLPNATSFGAIVEYVERPGFSVEAVTATWDFTLFAAKASRTLYLSVPRRQLASFLADLRTGRLDESIRSAVGAPHQGRVLRSHAQALERAVFDEVDPAATLTAPERDRHGRPTVARVSTAMIEETASRVGKGVAYVSPQSFVPRDRHHNWLWLLVALLAVLLVGGVAVALTGGGDDAVVATATTKIETPTTTAVTALSTAPVVTAAPTTLAPLPSVVIRTTFVFPVTTYTVVVDGADASSFTFAWRMIGNETPECAARLLVEGPDDRSVTWDHPHPPCAVGTDHAGTVIEAVGTSTNTRFTCRFQGAAASVQPCVVSRQ